MKDQYYYLGKITKTFGYKGELVFYFDVDDVLEYESLEMVFIDLHGDIIPYMIEKITMVKSNNAIVKLMDINTDENASRLVNAILKLPLDSLPELEGNKFYYHEVIGFEVWDKKEGKVGIIKEVNDTTAQTLFEIQDGYTEILFPVVDELILEVNREERKITVAFPEGLLDVYREAAEEE